MVDRLTAFPSSYRALKVGGRVSLWAVFFTALALLALHMRGIDVTAHRLLIMIWISLLVVAKVICDELAGRVLRTYWMSTLDAGSDRYEPWKGGARFRGKGEGR